MNKMDIKRCNKIVHQCGISPTERPAGRLPVNIPALAPDPRTQTVRRGTLRVSLVGFKETMVNVSNSLVITPQPSGRSLFYNDLHLMYRLFRYVLFFTQSIYHTVRIFGSFLPQFSAIFIPG